MAGSLGNVGSAIGGAFGGPVGSAIGGAIGGSLDNKSARKKAGQTAQMIQPRRISTGKSTLRRHNGEVSLSIDPSIRAGQESFLQNVRGLRDPANAAFDEFHEGIGGLRDEVAGLRADFEGNQSAFREATLNPVRESIARGRGDLAKELGRTGVKGSFSNQAKSNFELAAGRTLSDAEAQVENQRINNLGNLLGMDADLLKAGLASETGRTTMLLALEESLKGVSTERFQQEMQALGIGQNNPGAADAAGIISNQQGVERQSNIRLAGDILSGFDGFGSSSRPQFDLSQLDSGGRSMR